MYQLLIVEDEYEIRQGLKNYFPWGEIGFKVIADVENGKEALAIIQKKSIDVILCDIKMPMLSGIQLAKILYEQNSSIKIIFLSAYKDFEYAQKALVYGVKNYILKPTKFQELYEVFTHIKKELDVESIKKKDDEQVLLQEDQKESYHDKILAIIKTSTYQNFQTMTLQDAAHKVNMSSAYLSKYFKDKTGENYSDFLLRIKMDKAKGYLDHIEYKIYEVSQLVGYNNCKNFTRAFKKYYGITPKQYRSGEYGETE